MPATKRKHRRSKAVRKRESELKILNLTLTQWLGVLFMGFGVYVMLYGIVLIPQSGVSIGPISVTDIPGRFAAGNWRRCVLRTCRTSVGFGKDSLW